MLCRQDYANLENKSTEGTKTATGCAPWGTGSACQLAINQNDW